MIHQNYDVKVSAVLDICHRYFRLRGDTEDGVDADSLKDRMEDLENQAVKGEAGKSTSVNALLSELLKSVKSGLDAQMRDFDENIVALEKKWKAPQIIEGHIDEIRRRLRRCELSLGGYADDVKKQFAGCHASYRERLDKITSRCWRKIDRASAFADSHQAVVDYHGEMASFAGTIGARIESAFKGEVKRLGCSFKAEHDITVPTVDVSSIEAKTRMAAQRTVEAERTPSGFSEWAVKLITLGFKKYTEERAEYDEEAHRLLFKKEVCIVLKRKRNDFERLVREFADRIASDFKSKLKDMIDTQSKELETKEEEKEANKEIECKIDEAKKKRKEITEPLDRVSEMLANLP